MLPQGSAITLQRYLNTCTEKKLQDQRRAFREQYFRVFQRNFSVTLGVFSWIFREKSTLHHNLFVKMCRFHVCDALLMHLRAIGVPMWYHESERINCGDGSFSSASHPWELICEAVLLISVSYSSCTCAQWFTSIWCHEWERITCWHDSFFSSASG